MSWRQQCPPNAQSILMNKMKTLWGCVSPFLGGSKSVKGPLGLMWWHFPVIACSLVRLKLFSFVRQIMTRSFVELPTRSILPNIYLWAIGRELFLSWIALSFGYSKSVLQLIRYSWSVGFLWARRTAYWTNLQPKNCQCFIKRKKKKKKLLSDIFWILKQEDHIQNMTKAAG